MPTNYTNMIQFAITEFANDGIGLYNELKRIHGIARTSGASVVYPRRKLLNLTIPSSSTPIKLSPNTDFNNCVFHVTNTTGTKVDLFSLAPNDEEIQDVTIVNYSLLRKNAVIQNLTSTPKLIIVTDQNPWTYRSEGGNPPIPVERKDVLYVTGNVVQNDPIATYDYITSPPDCQYVDVSMEQKSFRNIHVSRTDVSNAVTNLLEVKYQYNVLIENVFVWTPMQPGENGIYEDECIKIKNSAKIFMNNINFTYTYSAIYHWGYGIRILNVWNTSISNLTACNPAKGVMGNENVNELTVEDSHLNRVDVHCYGRDITCTNCIFENITNTFHRYNRVSSFFGKLIFIDCTFVSFLPLRIDSDYNAFTPFDLILENCTLNVNSDHKSLVNTETMSTLNPRPELHAKCLPKIIITNMHLNIPSTVTDFCFIKLLNNDYTYSIHYMNTFIVYVTEYNQAGSAPVTIYDVNQTVTLTESLTRITNISMVYNLVGGS